MHERVLVVPRATLSDVPIPVLSNRNGSAELWLGANLHGASYYDRSLAEQSQTRVQLIPYVVLKCHDRYATYRRGKQGTETRLHDLLSVGLGGHVNPGDGSPGLHCLENAMLRELDEEVCLDSPYTRVLKGLLWDPTTPVGAVHLGIVTVLSLAAMAVAVREESKILDLTFLTKPQLLDQFDRLEPWSKAVVKGLL